MVKLNSNIDYIEYIRTALTKTIVSSKEIKSQDEGLPNSSFFIEFNINGDVVSFDKDRFFITLSIKSKGEYIDLGSINSLINNMKLNTESIDYYVMFLKKYYDKN